MEKSLIFDDVHPLPGDLGLQNLVPETRWLPSAAERLGALGASAFGAGFGGSCYAVVRKTEAEGFKEAWRQARGLVFASFSPVLHGFGPVFMVFASFSPRFRWFPTALPSP